MTWCIAVGIDWIGVQFSAVLTDWLYLKYCSVNHLVTSWFWVNHNLHWSKLVQPVLYYGNLSPFSLPLPSFACSNRLTPIAKSYYVYLYECRYLTLIQGATIELNVWYFCLWWNSVSFLAHSLTLHMHTHIHTHTQALGVAPPGSHGEWWQHSWCERRDQRCQRAPGVPGPDHQGLVRMGAPHRHHLHTMLHLQVRLE